MNFNLQGFKFNFKFTLRSYLLSLCVGLIIIVGGVIIVVNYITFSKANIKSSQERLLNSSETIGAQVNTYFKIAETGLRNGLLLIQAKQDMLGFLRDNELITAVYEADTAGNFYMVQRMAGEQFATVHISRSSIHPGIIESVINQHGQTLKTVDGAIGQYDPRSRPWYNKSLQEKKLAWTNIYRFYTFSSIPPDIGVTLSVPVFDEKKQLSKIFAIDISLSSVARYLSSIDMGNDCAAYVVDPAGNIKYLLLSKNVLQSFKFSSVGKVQNINDLNLPWAEDALIRFEKNGMMQFTYKFDNSKKLAVVIPLNEDFSNWHIIIVKSLDSFLSDYTKYFWLFIGFGVLLISLGVIGSIFLLFKLNEPIKRLLSAIKNLRELKFEETKYELSNLKEINILYDTLEFMEKGFKSFARYVPPALIQKLMNSGAVADVYGESREITTIFTDIKNFSAVAESMQPRELMFYLSEYFEAMTNVINSKGGTLDKYVGDAIMAIWGAPYDDKNHALHACQCALMIQSALERLNKVWKQKGLPELSMRCGINSGHSVVGNVGSRYRLSYTAMGDSVNLASRLEELNKEYGTTILVGEDTYRAVSDQFLFRMVDLVAARGKKESIYVYELLQREQCKQTPQELKQINTRFRDAFNVYRVRDWDRALIMFDALLKDYPDDRITLMFIERCKRMQANPPEKWDGAWSFKI